MNKAADKTAQMNEMIGSDIDIPGAYSVVEENGSLGSPL